MSETLFQYSQFFPPSSSPGYTLLDNETDLNSLETLFHTKECNDEIAMLCEAAYQ